MLMPSLRRTMKAHEQPAKDIRFHMSTRTSKTKCPLMFTNCTEQALCCFKTVQNKLSAASTGFSLLLQLDFSKAYMQHRLRDYNGFGKALKETLLALQCRHVTNCWPQIACRT